MIYLITGTPGTGKTSYFVKMWLDNTDGLFKFDDGTPRPLYFCHVDGLEKKKLKAHELTHEDIESMPLERLVPEGSVVVVDECDYVYPQRGAGRPVPDYVKTLKELRHHGLTLILITQNAGMIDSYLRALVGKHWHLMRRPIGSKIYEFQGVETNLTESNLKTSAWRPYRPDKRTFSLYKSASKHIKFKKSLHWAFYALPVILAVTAFLGYKALQPAIKAFDGETPKTESALASSPDMALSQPLAASAADLPVGSDVQDYMPRIPDYPETAPIYDQVRKVENMEQVVACVKSSDNCNCYSAQATLIKVSNAFCSKFLDGGHFDRYRQKVAQTPQIVDNANSQTNSGGDNNVGLHVN